MQHRRDHIKDKDEPHIPFFESELLDKFFKGAKAAFENKSEAWKPMREAFFHFFDCTRYFVLEDPRIHDRLADVPALGLLLLRRLGIFERILDNSLPTKCVTCEVAVLDDPETHDRFFFDIWPPVDIDDKGYSGYVKGRCNHCSKEPTYEEV